MKKLAVMYLRLSRDDGEEIESNSISSQRELIKAYGKQHGLNISCEYVDDGVSGATFNRPSFKRMMEELEKGKIETIIVKDLSRFGRDYIETGKYLQKIFPEKKVRFISINDNYDSMNADDIISSINAKYEIRVSATPNKRVVGEFYEIPEIDVINEGLITRFMYINDGLDTAHIENTLHETDILLEKADEVRKKIAQAYIDEKEDIRPLVLVQFPNLNDDLIEHVEEKLNLMGYSYENKLLASWFSAENKEDKDRKSKKLGKINIGTTDADSITKSNATPVFLLFKQALATGWDCPRAKILVKLRENMSETFEIQTLGRLRRMPKAKHYGREILDCSYLYTFDEKYKLEVIKAGNGFETQRVFLKEEPKKIKLVKETRNLDGSYIDEQAIRNRVYN